MKNNLEEVKRHMNNLSRVPAYNATISAQDVDAWLSNYSDTVFCNGQLRQICFDKITENTYKVYSKRVN